MKVNQREIDRVLNLAAYEGYNMLTPEDQAIFDLYHD